MAAQRSQAMIDAVELDSAAAHQARENFAQSPWPSRLSLHGQSIQTYAEHTTHTYDLIICNPPFFTNHLASSDSLRRQARHNDSLSFAELAQITARLLTDEGAFEVLIPASEHERFISQAQDAGLHINQLVTVQPTETKPATRHILRMSGQAKNIEHKNIIIRNSNGYTDEFTSLLKPYYLFL